MHTQVDAIYQGSSPLSSDPERPEYHRMVARYERSLGGYAVSSTGNQRSSRLLSMASANALVCIPSSSSSSVSGVQPGERVVAMLLRDVPPVHHADCFHQRAAGLDFPDYQPSSSSSLPSSAHKHATASAQTSSGATGATGVVVAEAVKLPSPPGAYQSFSALLSTGSTGGSNNNTSVSASVIDASVNKGKDWRRIRVALLTISDRV